MLLIYFALLFAVLEWIGEQKKSDLLIYISKPLVIICIILWIIINVDWDIILTVGFKFRLIWFILGLVFCLIGDIFLMLPERFLVPGLAFYLIGQFSYILGFGRVIPPAGNLIPGLILLALVAFVSGKVFFALARGLTAHAKKRLKFLVAIYTILISTMLYSALLTLLTNEWNYAAALVVSLGAIMFYISDILNAWNRFVKPLPVGRLKIMFTYHLAQISLAIGAALHFIFI